MTLPATHIRRLLGWGRTLARHGALRGIENDPNTPAPVRTLCKVARFGTIQPGVPDYAAAFRDPRFAPMTLEEWPQTRISLSILGPHQALPPGDRAQLLAQLRPGVDGLVLESGDGRRATFLPSVWAQLPEPADFLDHLLVKAGLPMSADIRLLRTWRYQTRTIDED